MAYRMNLWCPAGAIDPANLKASDPTRCITCMRCVEQCPAHARSISAVMRGTLELALKKLCATRRQPELFLPCMAQI